MGEERRGTGDVEEEEFIQNRTRAWARFLTRWDQHAVEREGMDGGREKDRRREWKA